MSSENQASTEGSLWKKKISRRKAIGAGAKVGVAAVAGIVIGGAAGYLGGSTAKAPAPASTETVTNTATQTVTQTVSGGGAAQTITQTQTVTSTAAAAGGLKLGTLKIGVPTFVSGPFAASGTQVQNATKMAINEIKASGILGSTNIEVTVADIGGVSADEVKTAFSQLNDVAKTHVNVTIWGTYGPGWDSTLNAGTPLITGDTPSGVSEFISAHPAIRLAETFGPVASGRQQNAHLNLIDQIRQAGQWKPRHATPTMYIVYSDFVWDTNWAGKLKEIATARGWNVVGFDLLPLGTTDWSTVISKAKVADPDAVFHCDLSPNDAAAFANQFTTSSPPKALLHNSAGFTSPLPLQVVDPKTLVGLTHFGSAGPIQGQRLAAFQTKYKQQFGIDANSDATHQYDSIYIAINAIRTAGSLDPAAIYNAIFGTVTPGLEGNWAFDPTTKLYYNYPEFTPDQIYQIQSHTSLVGEFWSIYPSTVANAQWQVPPWFG